MPATPISDLTGASAKNASLNNALWSALCAAFLLAISVFLAIAVHSAFLFVSAAPIIFELVEHPLAPAASPRSTIVANGLALLVGYSTLAVFGLRHAPSTLQAGVSPERGLAVLCAFAVLAALLVLLRATSPPAGSTLLVIMLGVMTQPAELIVMFVGVVVLAGCAVTINRLAGIWMPLWSSPRATASSPSAAAAGSSPP